MAREEGISISETIILLLLPVEFCYFTFCVEPRQILPRQFIKPQPSAGCSALQYSNPNIVVFREGVRNEKTSFKPFLDKAEI